MTDHVYKVIKLVGSSSTSVDDAVHNAINRASSTLRNLRWFQVVETRGYVDENKVAFWQVTLEIGFTLESGDIDDD